MLRLAVVPADLHLLGIGLTVVRPRREDHEHGEERTALFGVDDFRALDGADS